MKPPPCLSCKPLRTLLAETEANLARAQKTIDDFAKESLQDREKLLKAEKDLGVWKTVADLHLSDVYELRNSVAKVEKDAARYKDALKKIKTPPFGVAVTCDVCTDSSEIALDALKE